VLAVAADVHQRCIGSHRARLEVDPVVAHGLADLVEIFHECRRRVLAKVVASLQVSAASVRGARVEGRLEVALEVVVGAERRAVQAMTVAGSALIHQDQVVLLGITGGDQISRRFSGGLAWSTGDVKDGSLLGMGPTRWDEHDLQGQLAAAGDAPVLEDVVDAAAQLLLDVGDVAGR